MSRFKVLLLSLAALVAGTAMAVAIADAQPDPNGFLLANEHYQCYSVEGGKAPKEDRRWIRDQFGGKKVKIGKPRRLCAPAYKQHKDPGTTTNGTTVKTVVSANETENARLLEESEKVNFDGPHLVCYDVDSGQRPREWVTIHNQFNQQPKTVYTTTTATTTTYSRYSGYSGGGDSRDRYTGPERIKVLEAEEICVPTEKERKDGTTTTKPGTTNGSTIMAPPR